MPLNKRSFGTVISGNRQPNHELSIEQRSASVALNEAGKSFAVIAKEFNCSKSAAYKIYQRWQNDNRITSKPRKGRPTKLTKAERKHIVLLLKRDRKITWDAIV